MYNFEHNDFKVLYKNLIQLIFENGENVIVNKKKTREVINCSICLSDINNHVLDFTNIDDKRQASYHKYLHEEIKWYESGSLIAEDAPSSFWKKIADPEGKIQSNYGHMILFERKPYSKSGITSFLHAINLLKEDKLSRQVILHYNLPQHYDTDTKDIPCNISTQILIRDDFLYFLVFQRSSDLFRGLTYDLPWHCHLMTKFIDELNKIPSYNINAGSLTMLLGSAHIYQENIPFFKKYLNKVNS